MSTGAHFQNFNKDLRAIKNYTAMKILNNKAENFVRGKFVCQVTVALLAFSLIASLLTGCAGNTSNEKSNVSSSLANNSAAGAIVPLEKLVLAGKPVTFRLNSNSGNPHWDLGDGATADGLSATHTYQKPGVYRVVMGSKEGDNFNELSSAIVRVHTPETLHLPQVLLDTDAANEIDDQHAIAYTLFSELDVLAITSTGWVKWTDEFQKVLAVSWDSEDSSY
jgi:hypothetical protein